MRFVGFTLVIFVFAACGNFDHAADPGGLAPLDETAFHCKVEPILIRDCSYIACHGESGFPLRIYSVGKLRESAATDQTARTLPLTDSERHANFQSARGFAWQGVAPEDNLLVRKPLPASFGGYEHKGNAIYAGGDDSRVITIEDWLRGTLACGP